VTHPSQGSTARDGIGQHHIHQGNAQRNEVAAPVREHDHSRAHVRGDDQVASEAEVASAVADEVVAVARRQKPRKPLRESFIRRLDARSPGPGQEPLGNVSLLPPEQGIGRRPQNRGAIEAPSAEVRPGPPKHVVHVRVERGAGRVTPVVRVRSRRAVRPRRIGLMTPSQQRRVDIGHEQGARPHAQRCQNVPLDVILE
jgi:hypothetical protein